MAFGGARDSDWAHVRVEGDPARARAFIPAARVLLGAVKQASEAVRLGVNKLRRRVAPDVTIETSYVGGIPSVVIRVDPKPVDGRDLFPLQGFLSWPSDADYPDGIDFEYPQVVYTPPGAETQRETWRTYFYRAFEPFWTALGVSKRTYRAQGGKTYLPDGLRLFGNHRWDSGDGLVLSWFGPESGCIVNGAEPHFIAGTTVAVPVTRFYSTCVFYNGEALFDSRTIQSNDGYTLVGGACFRQTEGAMWLYVLLWNVTFSGFRIVRLEITRSTERLGFFDAKLPGTGGIVMTASSLPTPTPQYDKPWAHVARFNQSGTQVALYVAGGEPYDIGSFTAAEINAWFAPSPAATDPALAVKLRPSDARIVYDVDTGAYALDTFSTSYSFPELGPIAGDYVADQLVEVYIEHVAGLQPHNQVGAWYVFGGQRIPVAEQTAINAPGYRRDIVCLAPGDDRYLFLRTALSVDNPGTGSPNITALRSATLELWSGSGLLFEQSLGTFDGSTYGIGNLIGLTTEVTIPSLGITNQRVFDLTHGAFAAYGFGPFDAVSPSGRSNADTLFAPSAVLRPYFQHFRPPSPIPPPAQAARDTWTLSPFARSRRFVEVIFSPYPVDGTPTTIEGDPTPIAGTLYFSGLGFFAWNPALPLTTLSFTRSFPEGGLHGRLRAFSAGEFTKDDFPITRALCRVGDATLVSCPWFGDPDRSFVALAPSVPIADVTGLGAVGLRLHPAVSIGTRPLFEVT